MIDAVRWLFESEAEEGLFAAPGFLWLLLLIPLLAGLMLLMGRLHETRLRRLFSGEVKNQVRPGWVRGLRTARDVLLLTGITLGILALAGPRFDKQVQIVQAKGVDLVLVVDLSRSMDAQDVDPSRLERVRREIADLLDIMEADRVGLVIFAGGAYPRMPLSDDHQALRMLTDEMSTRDFQAQGSAMDQAIDKAVELLASDDTSTAGKAMVVFSDGEVHEPDKALAAASRARDAGVRIFSVGVGEAGAPIPLGQGLWQRDRQGRQVLTTPSPQMLRDLARIGGGAYVDSVPSDQDMRRLYQGEIRSLLQAGMRDTRPKIRWRAAWPWPLGGAVICVLIASWLGEGHRRWGMAAAVALAVGLAAAVPARAASLAQADAAYREGKYSDAARELTQLTQERPDDADLFQRLGAARYRAGDFEGAARAWSREAELRGDDLNTLFDLGNANARAGRLERALEYYDRVLEGDPDNTGAQTNRQLVQSELERRRAMQPPPEPQQSDEQQSEEGEQGEQGEPQQGEPQDGEQDPQQGEQGDPQQGEEGEEKQQGDKEGEEGQQDEEQEAQNGTAEGEREQTDRQQSGDNPTEPQDSQGRKQTGDDQERKDESDVDGVRPEDVDPNGTVDNPEGGGEPAELTPEEAAARRAEEMLEGVKEGRPRVTIPGGSGENPW